MSCAKAALVGLLTVACSLSVIAAEKTDSDDKKWDVNKPPGKAYFADIDVSEGTWMNLDVSPDGKTIAFDLLGDIYVLPVSGGEAKNITNSIAWDMQPRFSPDGSRLAFTSDQGGGDNIWLMNPDGSEQVAVTNESFRLLNNPVWSPDGRFIAARKHFTGQRSLGAGEIWLYHKSGGTGVQLNKRPNEQKDLGEPAFTPDGRYVLYSRDTTPGPVFEYSKDSNQQIYEIFRIDRETGETESLVSGPGGAVRPTPSPDGKYLAFVRRIRNQSSLFLKDMTTGEELPIYENLDRDMQETWAIHGVYPNFAWTPDSKSIFFWAGGKIRRIGIDSREVAVVPFHIKDKREMREAVRFEVDVAPDQVDVRMLRWLTLSPRGNKAVFQALGYLYIMDLPDGKPRRLTRQDEHFELYPSFSRDGQWIVYSTWNDEQLGSIRKINVFGEKPQVLTREPGHYIAPRFSPHGRNVVYEKIEGGYLTNPKYSMQPGIYRVSANGGGSDFVTNNGSDAFFAKATDRIFMKRTRREGEVVISELVSTDFAGDKLRSHYEGEWIDEFSVSPDATWLAFSQRYHVYAAPFVEGGVSIGTGPKADNLPVRRFSEFSGESLAWSSDGATLSWSLGPTLYYQQVAQVFDWQKPENDAQDSDDSGQTAGNEQAPQPDSLTVKLAVDADKPEGITALTGARIITMKGDEVIEEGTLVIDGNRILAVGAGVEIPDDAKVIDVKGKTIIPGLVDVHWHGSMGQSEIIPQNSWVNYASLAFGVTTIHDPSNDTTEIFAAKELQQAGRIVGPRIFSTGTILYGATHSITAEVNSVEDAKQNLQRLKAVGAFSVKSYNQPRRDQRQQILEAARQLNMMVVPEGGSLFQHNMSMVVDGHTGIEHSIPVAAAYDDVMQLWGQSRTGYTPTLVVAYGGIWGEHYWYAESDVWKHPVLSRFVPRNYLEPRSVRRIMAPTEDYNHFNIAKVAKQLHDAGVSVQLGAHGQREGLGAHWELWMFGQGGMTPLEALQAATINGARYLGMDKDIGSLEAGKLADLVILNANPLKNLRNSEKIDQVMLNGRLFDTDTMNEVDSGDRDKFWFE